MTSVSSSSSTTAKTEEEEMALPPPLTSSSFSHTSTSADTNTKKKAKRVFRFTDHPHRKVALRLAYHGHVHDGLAIQRHTSNTVEGLLCDALRELNFVPTSIEDQKALRQQSDAAETCGTTENGIRRRRHRPNVTEWKPNEVPLELSRCGRTDKGVSALGNCVSLVCRSSCWPTDVPPRPPIDYATKLNRILPSTIRVVGYAEVDEDFDARFSCTARTYRYYFCHKGLDVEAMRRAGKHLVGVHHFRNFCVLDVVNVGSLVRRVEAMDIFPSAALPDFISYVELRANSFLYHQVRCIMSVLFLVGRHLEHPSIVDTLLRSGDRKPYYPLADSAPLVLWECHYTTVDPISGTSSSAVSWQMSKTAMEEVQSALLDITTALLIRATAADAMRQQLCAWYPVACALPHRNEGTWGCGESRETPRQHGIGRSGKEVPEARRERGVSTPNMATSCSLTASSSSFLLPCPVVTAHQNDALEEEERQQKETAVEKEEGSPSEVEVYASSWSPTGYDWTLPHADDLRRSRQLSVFREKKLSTTTVPEGTPLSSSVWIQGQKEEEVIERLQHFPSLTGASDEKREKEEEEKERINRRIGMECIQRCREKEKGYVPLLLRETERTYEEQVTQLGGSKRARYEESMRKKEKHETLSNST